MIVISYFDLLWRKKFILINWWAWGSFQWKFHNVQHLVKVLQINLLVKHAWAQVVLRWVTYGEVLVFHLCEHHLYSMSAKRSIYCHERWICVNHYSLNMGQWVWLKNYTFESWELSLADKDVPSWIRENFPLSWGTNEQQKFKITKNIKSL